MAYDIGDGVRLTCTFTTVDGVLADPSNVAVTHLAPGAESVAYVYGDDEEVVRASVGVYHIYVYPTVSGKHQYRWVGSGTLASVAEGAFFVDAQRVF